MACFSSCRETNHAGLSSEASPATCFCSVAMAGSVDFGFVALRRLRFAGGLVLASISALRAFSAFTSATRLEATPAREARSAISPSLVLGV